MIKIGISTKSLDETVADEMLELSCSAFAIHPRASHDKRTYLIFTDTSEHDALWQEITRGWGPTEDWGEKLQELFKKRPELKQQTSKESKYNVSDKALKINHELGGAHGELHLRYAKTNLIFMPLSDYAVLQGDPIFINECTVVYDGKFIKGSLSDLEDYKVRVLN